MDTFIDYTLLLSLGTKWFEFIVDVTVKGTIILILAYFVNLVWRRASAAARNLVWKLAIVSLLIVPLFSLVLPEWEVSIFSYNHAVEQPLQSDKFTQPQYDEQQAENLTNNEESAGNISTIMEPLSDDSQSSSVIERAGLFIKNVLSNMHWSIWLLSLWLLGTLFVFARLLVGYTVMRRITKHFIPVKNHTLNCIAADCADETGIKRPIQLLQCSRLAVPMTRGWLKPKIILPEEAQSWPEKRRRSVILHELAHVKRLDCLSSFVIHAVSVMYWFNPLVWVAVRKLYVECEQACDDLVLEAGTKASDYANHLVEVARSLVSSKWAPSLEVAMARKSALEGRLLAIFNDDKPRNHMRLSTALIIGLLGISFVMLLACVQTESQNIQVFALSDVLTLELSFGADEKNLPEEYLLAIPSLLTVNNNGDIIVSDEYRLKVYDSTGNPKKILGGPGEGPGEFSRKPSQIQITETGYMSVKVSGANIIQKYNMYAPGYNFIEQKNFQYSDVQEKIYEETARDRIQFRAIYCYSPEEFLFMIRGSNYPASVVNIEETGGAGGRSEKLIDALVYQDNQTLQNVLIVENPDRTEDGILIRPEEGIVHYGLLQDRRIVYTHAAKYKSFENNTYYYSLFVYDMNTLQKTEIKQPYTQVTIPDSVIYFVDESSQAEIDELKRIGFEAAKRLENSLKKLQKDRTQRLKEVKYYPGVNDLLTDGDVIFVFTHERSDKNGQVVHFIDSMTGKRISSVYFPFIPEVIKNGYAYIRNLNEDGFYVVEKYKIDPAVYGK